jgi:hypothetical protein
LRSAITFLQSIIHLASGDDRTDRGEFCSLD